MKRILERPGYSFDPASKKVYFSPSVLKELGKLGLITNVTTQAIIYQFNDTAKGGSLLNDTLTLEYDTTAMSRTDELQIILDGPEPTNDQKEIANLLRELLMETREIKDHLITLR